MRWKRSNSCPFGQRYSYVGILDSRQSVIQSVICHVAGTTTVVHSRGEQPCWRTTAVYTPAVWAQRQRNVTAAGGVTYGS